jgi:hypothetical protein
MANVYLTKAELSVLAHLHASANGQVVRQIVTKRLAEHDRDCRRLDGPELHRAQGRAQELAWLLDTLADAQKVLEQPQTARYANPAQRIAYDPNPGQ